MKDRESSRPLPIIHDRRERRPADLFRVEQLDLEFANGERRTYERLISRGVGAVIVVAMPDDDHVLLIREYACGVHRYELGLPKGRLEPGETYAEGANRELQEECGYGARSLTELGHLTLAPGYMTHRTHIILARDLYESRLPGDEPEDIEVVEWPMNDLISLIRREDCTEGRTIAALYMARDMLAGG
ncbi:MULTISPECIES: ADP compounds hydrolase NudE [unclassified Wenzhouxiangella]|uniref:ADP compounds hydrolase NudE n=1 Tax=unclassified Wenzhouxiangella TaxID=2613841 RepID=UPI000E32543B|nr:MULTISPECIES: ADP compounds hydrolase NudE [unclassified Wenzhouxiangella]RFF28507.1 ADP compounds hydrolase NudE [Wenzhouxiangella sp. 15181]RFP70025.1 ADP compounds hydrolase NudE [Wenzhouxiangella sp. 15190]